jgi:hypothetical protein
MKYRSRFYLNFLFLFFLFFILDLPAFSEEYNITLKNGRVVRTTSCYRDGDMFYYQKYGTSIGIQNDMVKDVSLVKHDPSIRVLEGPKTDNEENDPTKPKTEKRQLSYDERRQLNDQLAKAKTYLENVKSASPSAFAAEALQANLRSLRGGGGGPVSWERMKQIQISQAKARVKRIESKLE